MNRHGMVTRRKGKAALNQEENQEEMEEVEEIEVEETIGELLEEHPQEDQLENPNPPEPEIEEILKRFHGIRYISTWDTVCGYWQVAVSYTHLDVYKRQYLFLLNSFHFIWICYYLFPLVHFPSYTIFSLTFSSWFLPLLLIFLRLEAHLLYLSLIHI